MWYLPQIEFMDFAKDHHEKKISSISHLVGKLNMVKTLNLHFNFLTSLPETLVFCQELKKLSLENNEFKELPLFLKDMPQLETVYRYGNQRSETYDCSYSMKISKHKIRVTESEENLQEELLEEHREVLDNREKEDDGKPKQGKILASLLELSSKSICKQVFRNPAEIDKLNIPRHLKDLIFFSADSFKFCYNCKKGMDPVYECKFFCFVFIVQF